MIGRRIADQGGWSSVTAVPMNNAPLAFGRAHTHAQMCKVHQSTYSCSTCKNVALRSVDGPPQRPRTRGARSPRRSQGRKRSPRRVSGQLRGSSSVLVPLRQQNILCVQALRSIDVGLLVSGNCKLCSKIAQVCRFRDGSSETTTQTFFINSARGRGIFFVGVV